MNRERETLRVVLADNHHFFREGLRSMLEEAGVAVLGEAADGEQAVALVRRHRPDVVAIDLDMPQGAFAGTLREIAATSPQTHAFVLASGERSGSPEMLAALDAGASGCMLKEAPAKELIAGICACASGQVVLSRDLLTPLVANALKSGLSQARTRAAAERAALSARERDVLELLADGADNATIGTALSISPHTVKQHVANIFEKLGVKTRVEAAVYAVRSGLV